MQIEPHTTLIAPSALHLDLYRRIIEQKGNCLNITVLTLDAYIARSLGKPKTPLIRLLFLYARALDDLPEDNLFYPSRREYSFLKDCEEFMNLVALYGIDSFPEETKRQKDLKEIIDRLSPIRLWTQEARTLPFEDASQLRIIRTEYSLLHQYWIDLLISKGAKFVDFHRHKRTYYWACSNARKEMEACADAIVANDLNASSVMIALADPSQKYVLAQALESRGIPYTFAQSDYSRRIVDQWKSALLYLKNKDEDSLLDLLETLFPQSSYDLRRWIRLFGAGTSSVQNVAWRPNALISQELFTSLQELEVSVSSWRPLLEQMKEWTIDSIDQIGQLIMDQTPSPAEDDLKAYEGVMTLIGDVREELESVEDLDLLISSLDSLHPSQALLELKGVLVGDRHMISGLYDNIFYIGADASNFPGSQARTGVFDEQYMELLKFPSLEERNTTHFENLKRVLEETESLFILTPQSDYVGKSIESSHDLNMWLGMLPKFKPVPEPSSNPRPAFVLSGISESALFPSENGVLQARPKALKTFEDCALKNLLQYGLRLKAPASASDLFQIKSDFLPWMMQKAWTMYHLHFDELKPDQIQAMVDDDFSFARELFASKKETLDSLAALCSGQLAMAFERLKPVRQEMNLDLVSGDYEVRIEKDFDGIPMNIEGSITLASSRKSVFNLVEPSGSEFISDGLPRATIDLGLQPKATWRPAFTIAYKRGAVPAAASPVTSEQAAQQGRVDFFRSAMSAQNLEAGTSALADVLHKKVPTYSAKEEKMSEQAGQLAKSISENNFRPFHKPDVCSHCSFRAICRNAAVERG